MSTPVVILIAVASAVVFGLIGAFAGFTYRKRVSEKLIKSAEVEASRIREEAKKEGETKKKEFLLEAKEESLRIKNEADRELKERRADLQRQEKRVLQKEESLDRKSEQYDKKDEILNQKIKQADELKAKIEEPRRNDERGGQTDAYLPRGRGSTSRNGDEAFRNRKRIQRNRRGKGKRHHYNGDSALRCRQRRRSDGVSR